MDSLISLIAFKQHFVLPPIPLLIINIHIHCKLAFYSLSTLKILEINSESIHVNPLLVICRVSHVKR